jgi:hypothetical protein
MHLEAKTTITKELYRRFVKYHLHRRKGIWRTNQILLPVLLALCLLLLWMTSFETNGIILTAFAIMLNLLATLLPFISSALGFRRMPKDRLAQQFTFNDETFEVVNNSSSRLVGNTIGRYDGLVTAVESTDDFYLFVEKNQAFLVQKKDFTVGDPAELANRLAELLGPQYKKTK